MRNKKLLSVPFFFFLAFIIASALAKGVFSFSLDKRISLCRAPSTPQRISGPNFNEVIYSEPFTVSAKDISSFRSCFPHDIVFSIWENVDGTYQKIRSSHWLDDRIIFYGRTYSWPWEALPAGEYQWRVNLKNTNEQTLQQPLVVPFTVNAQDHSTAIANCKADMSRRLGISQSSINLVGSIDTWFRDSCYDCSLPPPFDNCLRGVFEGWTIVLQGGGWEYRYHTTENGTIKCLKQAILLPTPTPNFLRGE